MRLYPTKEVFQEKAKVKKLVAVSVNIDTDLDTPVSMYYKLVGEEKGFLLESADAHQQLGRYSFIGAEPFINLQVYKDRLMIQEEDRLRAIDGNPVDSMNAYFAEIAGDEADVQIPLAKGGAVGYFNYETVAVFDRVRGLEVAKDELLGQFMICRILLVFDQQKNESRLIYLSSVEGKADLEQEYEKIQQRLSAIIEKISQPLSLEGYKNTTREEKLNLVEKYQEMPKEFADSIHKCKEYIKAGDIFQVVPSKQFTCTLTKPAFLFYRKLRRINPSPYMFYLNFGKRKFVAASPEMLVKVAGGNVYTYPIAGTRRRGENELEDKALERELVQDIKECAEHSMLVDLARNDIGRISKAGSVQVTKLRQVERFSHVMHMVSEVMGELKEGYTPMDVLRACFPAGTVSGAPKLRAMEIINELEPVKRGAYAGTVGYMDLCGNMDMCITLRTMIIDDNEAKIQAGAGIVYDSQAEFEYKEILQKAKAMFRVVEEVENNDSFIR